MGVHLEAVHPPCQQGVPGFAADEDLEAALDRHELTPVLGAHLPRVLGELAQHLLRAFQLLLPRPAAGHPQ